MEYEKVMDQIRKEMGEILWDILKQEKMPMPERT